VNNLKSLRIGLFTSSFLPSIGGVEIGLHNIATQLLKKGHKPTVITSYNHANNLKRQSWCLPYKVLSYPPKIFFLMKFYPYLAGKLLDIFYKRLQKKNNFDFWHATFAYPTGISIIKFCNKNKIKYLVRSVGEDIQINKELNYGMRLNKNVNKELCNWLPSSKKNVAVTNSIKGEYLKLGIPKENIIKIPNGVDLNRISNFKSKINLKSFLGIKDTKTVFLSLGRFHPKKNFELVLESTRKLKQKNNNFVVIIAGTNVGKLKSVICKNNLENNVILYEPNSKKNTRNFPSDEVFSLYKLADIFLMPSIIESFGIVTIEAMAFGLPIIINDAPGNRDLVRNGKDGFIISGTSRSLAMAMENFLINENIRKKYKKKSISRAKKFDWSLIVDKYIDIYRQ